MIGLAPPIGRYAPDFELPDTAGAVHHLTRYLEMKRAVLVVVLSNRCPDVHACVQELNALHQEFSGQGVALVGINANDDVQAPEESYQNMKQFAQDSGLQFPYLRDMTQDVVRTFGARKTPEAFLLDAEGKIQYTGAVLPAQTAPVLTPHSKTPLREAIAQLLSGQSIAVPSTPTTGCPILWRKA
ncbi:MAG: thioredoxin family protein [Leptolyngbyaceae bacterium]|nr:thioredoxin family protein [Leptolyngbyaceae bacterium]